MAEHYEDDFLETDSYENEDKYRIILCGSSAYDKKYYFNRQFDKVPESVKEELHIMCVLFTEEVGGAFMIGFDEDGSVMLITDANEDDILDEKSLKH